MTYPKISIVTPNFNQERYLEATILSVLTQGYPNLEYIIIDGGSTDGSLEIIKKYSNQLSYWISEPDGGMYEAIQKGFDKSTGEIMAWINSDDMYHPGALFVISDIFQSFPEVNWLLGAMTSYDEKGRTIGLERSKSFSKYDFYIGNFKWIQQESVFWRKSLWERTGSKLNFNLKYAGDLALWLSFFAFENLYVIDALIGGFRQRSEHQLSLDYFNDYIIESNILLNSVSLSKKDRIIVDNYKRMLSIVSFLNSLKIIRTDWIIPRFKKMYFPESYRISYNRFTKKFELDRI